MASCSQSSNKSGKYVVRSLDRVVKAQNAICIKFSTATSLVGLAFKKIVKILRLDYQTFTSKLLTEYHSDFEVKDIVWSPNSQALLVISLQSCQFTVIQNFEQLSEDSIFRVNDPNLVNLSHVEWTPDGQHLISIADCNLYTFLHSLHDGRRLLIPSICCTVDRKPLMSFNPEGKYLAYVYFESSSYHMILMSTSLWVILFRRKLQLCSIKGLEWSPNSSILAVWDNQKTVSVLELNGDLLQTVHYNDPPSNGFVIAVFSPKCDLFATACVQNKMAVILVYNIITWQMTTVLDHREGLCEDLGESSYPMINQLGFSPCGNFLASSMMRGSVLIWSVREGFKLNTLLNIQHFSAGLLWHPHKTQLAISTENGMAHVWKYPQDGPVVKRATLSTVNTGLASPTAEMIWSKNNVIVSPIGSPGGAIILIRNKKL